MIMICVAACADDADKTEYCDGDHAVTLIMPMTMVTFQASLGRPRSPWPSSYRRPTWPSRTPSFRSSLTYHQRIIVICKLWHSAGEERSHDQSQLGLPHRPCQSRRKSRLQKESLNRNFCCCSFYWCQCPRLQHCLPKKSETIFFSPNLISDPNSVNPIVHFKHHQLSSIFPGHHLYGKNFIQMQYAVDHVCIRYLIPTANLLGVGAATMVRIVFENWWVLWIKNKRGLPHQATESQARHHVVTNVFLENTIWPCSMISGHINISTVYK